MRYIEKDQILKIEFMSTFYKLEDRMKCTFPKAYHNREGREGAEKLTDKHHIV